MCSSKIIIYDLLALSLIEIRYEAYITKQTDVFYLADLFHNTPRHLKKCNKSTNNYEEIIDNIVIRAKQIGLEDWLGAQIKIGTKTVPPRSMIYQLLSQALLEIREKSQKVKHSKNFHLANLFCELPLKLEKTYDVDDYDVVLDGLIKKAKENRIDKWIENQILHIQKFNSTLE